MVHYDIRLVCEVTGEHEATESIFYSRKAAEKEIARNVADRERYGVYLSQYVMVECDRPVSDPVHDVDVAYFTHQTEHKGHKGIKFVRYVGKPETWHDGTLYEGWE